MKHDWKYIKLGDIISPAKVVRNGANKKFPVLSITMRDGIVFQSSRFKKSIASVDTSDYKVVYNGQLVIAFPIDEGLIYTQDIVDAGIMSPAYNVWNVDFLEIDRKFLVLYLHCPFSMAYYKSKLRGTTMRRRSMPKEDLLNMPLPVPSFSVQQSIISELDKINELIRLKKEQLKDYDNLAQSIFYEMFGDPIENEKGWEVKKLSSITSKIGSGATPKGGNESYKTEGISLIRSLNVHNNEFLYKDLAHIDNEQAEALSNVEIKEYDVLLNITGASVARCCIVPDDVIPARVNQHVCIVRTIQEKALPIFINRVLTNENFQANLLRLARSKAATREALPKSIVDNIQVPLPPLSLQQLFAQRIELIEQQKAEIKSTIADLETLLASRMQYWFD